MTSPTAPTVIGPHLLGRIPSPFDARDYRLERYLDGTEPDATHADTVRAALAELEQTTVGYRNHSWTVPPAGTHWKAAVDLLAKIAPPAPSPVPSGDFAWMNPRDVLDQLNFGTCVGNGWAQWGNTNPVNDDFTEGVGSSATQGGPYARAVYYEATVLDGTPDDPDAPGGGQQGSTVRSGAKAMLARGRLDAYAFTAQTATVRSWVRAKGPVVLGTDWTDGMFNPDQAGVVHPTGNVAGGHCYLCLGDVASEQNALLLNSWGSTWALAGLFKMAWTDLQKLLDGNGEACTAVELP